MSRMRAALIGFLTVALMVTSGTASVARIASHGSSIVICTPEGLETITVNAEGEPVTVLPHCPDCLVQTYGLFAPVLQVQIWISRLIGQAQPLSPSIMPPLVLMHETARGPPGSAF
ncbi:MAG: hypothetical protein AAF700_06695 [Pseudomonadota bacterium]